MKKLKLFMALLATLFATLIFALPLHAAEPTTLTVNGTGAVSIAPDIATVNLGVSTQHTNPQRALAENNTQTTAVIAALRALDIDEDDIRTSNFFIDPVFGFDWVEVTGYRVTNTIMVTVRDIDQIGDVLGAGVSAGANISHGISFGVSDSAAAYNQALALAIQNAQIRAAAMADALDTRITGMVSVVEVGGMHMPISRAHFGMAMAVAEADVAASVPIEAGDLIITANVQIIYTIAP